MFFWTFCVFGSCKEKRNSFIFFTLRKELIKTTKTGISVFKAPWWISSLKSLKSHLFPFLIVFFFFLNLLYPPPPGPPPHLSLPFSVPETSSVFRSLWSKTLEPQFPCYPAISFKNSLSVKITTFAPWTHWLQNEARAEGWTVFIKVSPTNAECYSWPTWLFFYLSQKWL